MIVLIKEGVIELLTFLWQGLYALFEIEHRRNSNGQTENGSTAKLRKTTQ